MVELNDRIKDYMNKFGWKDIVLNIEKITSWCAPPYLEMSVGFTEKNEGEMLEEGYISDKSELGKVYYPSEGIRTLEQVTVKYVEYPWITCFEVEGIEILKTE